MAERTEGEEEPEKIEEMEVKDKIEETKEENGIKGRTLKTKTTETDHEMKHNGPGDNCQSNNCPGRQLPWETTVQTRKTLCNYFVISLY